MISLKTKDWELNNIETILFDKDGTFIDLHYFWGQMTELRVKETIKIFNLQENYIDKLCEILGYDIHKKQMKKDGITALFSRVKIINIYTQSLKNMNIKTTEEEITEIFDAVSDKFYLNMHKYTKPIHDAINFIKKLHDEKIKIGIVTSDSVISTQKTIKYFEWEDLFSSVIGRESSEYTKESGEPTKIALKELNAKPETTIMIGDAPMDYISAKNSGLKATILVSTGQIDENELKKTSNYTVKSLKDIKIIKKEYN